jgi:hypothetical protein
MMDSFDLPEGDDEEMDIYQALGLNKPVESSTQATALDIYDPLAAFMDDDEDDELVNESTDVSSASVSQETVETLLATLARDLLDDERLSASLIGGHADLASIKVQRDREAYHLSLIVDMGGTHIRPFATVLAVDDAWKPLSAPKGLHAKWKPLYESLCNALASALAQQGHPSSI